ncbi:sulfatase family protein [Microbacterium sp. JB110]|uniref:sulfatase family protein n=1 Tax=Microbacterium sp. JB110 TaxID=2024477 RepID=UPI00097E97F3|nr:sulfatase [Microbacterium sp. JB110]RCS60071.1 sulfatase [Microbacterium sp. JB110]SJM45268.1 probable sulfatase [Frigoribacterium sp. JB110]
MQTPPSPDIFLIHVHDLGDWLPCYGHPSVSAPNLQRLADEGVVFDSAFATSPLCTPARSSMFTGQLPHENGLMGLSHAGWRYREGVVTLPEMLGELGYCTALLGLQHEDLDARRLGYDEVHGLGFLPRAMEVAELAERWLPEADDEAPMFASIGLWEVHRPWPEYDYAPHDPAAVEVPGFLPDNADTRHDLAGFYGAIAHMDEAVGRILRAIDASARRRESIVVFTTDHGPAFPGAKSTLYDPGVKVAFLVRPPRSWEVRPGRRNAPVSHLDIVPTFVEVAGGEASADLPGESMLPLLSGSGSDSGGRQNDRALFLEKTHHDRYDPIRAVRTARAKYIRNYVDGPRLPLPDDLERSQTRRGMGDAHLAWRPPEELYLLGDDPTERRNAIDDSRHAETREHMRALLDEHMRATADPVATGVVPAPVRPEKRER